MYYKRNRSTGPYSESSSYLSRGLSSYSYTRDSNKGSGYLKDIGSSSFSPRNPSLQRVMNTDYSLSDRSRDFSSSYSRLSALRPPPLPSTLSAPDTSPTVRRRDYESASAVSECRSPGSPSTPRKHTTDSDTSSYSPTSRDDAPKRNYNDSYVFSSSISKSNYFDYSMPRSRFSTFGTSGIKIPKRTDYSDYFRPVLQERPMVKSGYVPRSRAERESACTPIVRERKLIKFREMSSNVPKDRRRISWDISNEINSPLLNQLKDMNSESLSEWIESHKVRSRDNSLSRLSNRSSPVPGSPIASRRGLQVRDKSVDRMTANDIIETHRSRQRSLSRLKSPRTSVPDLPESPTDKLELLRTCSPTQEYDKVLPSSRKNSLSALRKSKKKSISPSLNDQPTAVKLDTTMSSDITKGVTDWASETIECKVLDTNIVNEKRDMESKTVEISPKNEVSDGETVGVVSRRRRRRDYHSNVISGNTEEEKGQENRTRCRSRSRTSTSDDKSDTDPSINDNVSAAKNQTAELSLNKSLRKSIKFKCSNVSTDKMTVVSKHKDSKLISKQIDLKLDKKLTSVKDSTVNSLGKSIDKTNDKDLDSKPVGKELQTTSLHKTYTPITNKDKTLTPRDDMGINAFSKSTDKIKDRDLVTDCKPLGKELPTTSVQKTQTQIKNKDKMLASVKDDNLGVNSFSNSIDKIKDIDLVADLKTIGKELSSISLQKSHTPIINKDKTSTSVKGNTIVVNSFAKSIDKNGKAIVADKKIIGKELSTISLLKTQTSITNKDKLKIESSDSSNSDVNIRGYSVSKPSDKNDVLIMDKKTIVNELTGQQNTYTPFINKDKLKTSIPDESNNNIDKRKNVMSDKIDLNFLKGIEDKPLNLKQNLKSQENYKNSVTSSPSCKNESELKSSILTIASEKAISSKNTLSTVNINNKSVLEAPISVSVSDKVSSKSYVMTKKEQNKTVIQNVVQDTKILSITTTQSPSATNLIAQQTVVIPSQKDSFVTSCKNDHLSNNTNDIKISNKKLPSSVDMHSQNITSPIDKSFSLEKTLSNEKTIKDASEKLPSKIENFPSNIISKNGTLVVENKLPKIKTLIPDNKLTSKKEFSLLNNKHSSNDQISPLVGKIINDKKTDVLVDIKFPLDKNENKHSSISQVSKIDNILPKTTTSSVNRNHFLGMNFQIMITRTL